MRENAQNLNESLGGLRIGPEEVHTPNLYIEDDCELYLPGEDEEIIEDPYSPEKPFELRIYRAVDNYNKKKLTDMQRQILAKYLAFGGIKTGQKQFINSVNKNQPEDIDKDLEVGASLDINEFGSDDEKVVDFWSTIREFLVEFLITCPYSFEETFHKETPKTIKAFLEYLNRASVCPEYKEDVDHSIKLCDKSLKELSFVHTLAIGFPDKFNIACNIRFGGNRYDYFGDALGKPIINTGEGIPLWADIKFQENSINLTLDELAEHTDKLNNEAVKIKQSVFLKMRVAEITDHFGFPNSSLVKYDKVLLERFYHDSLVDFDNRVISPIEFSSCGYEIYSDILPETIEIFMNKELVNNELLGIVFSGTFNLLTNGVWYADSVNRFLPNFQFLDRPF